MTEKEKFVEELRCLADFYAGAPDDLPRPFIQNHALVTRKELSNVIRICSKLTKEEYAGHILLRKSLIFGSMVFQIGQSEVCERKVVGQKWVEPVPAREGHFVDQVEWECKPILKSVEKEETDNG